MAKGSEEAILSLKQLLPMLDKTAQGHAVGTVGEAALLRQLQWLLTGPDAIWKQDTKASCMQPLPPKCLVDQKYSSYSSAKLTELRSGALSLPTLG